MPLAMGVCPSNVHSQYRLFVPISSSRRAFRGARCILLCWEMMNTQAMHGPSNKLQASAKMDHG